MTNDNSNGSSSEFSQNNIPTVIIVFDKDGDMGVYVTDDSSVKVFTIDERAPGDRVYEITSRVPREEIESIMGSDEIGTKDNERGKILTHRIISEFECKSHITLASDNTNMTICTTCGGCGTILDRVDGEITCPDCGYQNSHTRK